MEADLESTCREGIKLDVLCEYTITCSPFPALVGREGAAIPVHWGVDDMAAVSTTRLIG
jgi:hypothetical protein